MNRRLSAAALLLALCACAARAGILSGTADGLLGQQFYTTNDAHAITDATLNNPYGVAVDTANDRLFIADRANHRILWWNNASVLAASGASADGVIGQADFVSNAANRGGTPAANTLHSPRGLWVDVDGNLWAADAENNRVLRFSAPFTAGADKSADLVLGQGTFSSTTTVSATQTGLKRPYDVFVDTAAHVWVADNGYHRVLRFPAPVSSGAAADIVLGQANFTNGSGSVSQTRLRNPSSVRISTTGAVCVADTNNYRVMVFTAPVSSGMAASVVLGQSVFNANPSSMTVTAASLTRPNGLRFDPAGNLWVTDGDNSSLAYVERVVRFSMPLSSGMNADYVLGQSDSQTGYINRDPAAAPNQPAPPARADGLFRPMGITFDGTGRLWVADQNNNRAACFALGSSTAAAVLAVGQPSLTSNAANHSDASVIYNPYAVAIDTTAGRAFAADYNNNRVLWWDTIAAFADGAPATGVLGQADLYANAANRGGTTPSSDTLKNPSGVSVDPAGNPWVADTGNNRVLRFSGAALSTGAAADLVIGQATFLTAAAAAGAQGLSAPRSVRFDRDGYPWVVDGGNHRALRYGTTYAGALANNESAALVLGQADMSGGSANRGGVTAADGLSSPTDIGFNAANDPWVVDYGNNRVLVFSDAGLADGVAAAYVLGQNGFGTSALGSGSSGFNGPWGIAFDAADQGWVADTVNHRFMRFGSVAGNNQAAAYLLGHGGTAQNALNQPRGLAFDQRGRLWAADTNNNRLLVFATMTVTGAGAPQGAVRNGVMTISVTGTDFGAAMNATLTRSGHADIPAAQVTTNAATSLTARFDLTGAATGQWDLVVSSLGFSGSVPAAVDIAVMYLTTATWAYPVVDSTMTAVIAGDGFGAGTTATLERGTVTLSAFSVVVDSHAQVTARFDLTGAATGWWDLTVATAPMSATIVNAVQLQLMAVTGVAVSGNVVNSTMTAVITGRQFIAGTGAALARAGQPDIAATAVTVDSATQITAQFYLLNAATGWWDLRVASGGATAALSSAVLVLSSYTPVAADPDLSAGADHSLTYTLSGVQVTLDIPAGAFAADFRMTCGTTAVPAGDRPGLADTPIVLEVTNSNGQQPLKDIVITVVYTDADAVSWDERRLVICRYDPDNDRWLQIPSTPDPAANRVRGVIRHLSVFRVFQRTALATLDDAFAYPTPYRPGSGGAHDDSALGKGIVFANLTENVRIRLFTVTGELVRDIALSGTNGTWVWDIANDSGETVASGVYLYLITVPGDSAQKAKGKVAIIR